jgi:hypothetical protein
MSCLLHSKLWLGRIRLWIALCPLFDLALAFLTDSKRLLGACSGTSATGCAGWRVCIGWHRVFTSRVFRCGRSAAELRCSRSLLPYVLNALTNVL